MEQPQAAAGGGSSDHPEQQQRTEKSGDYAPYPKLDPIDLETPPLFSAPTVQPQLDPRAPPGSAAAAAATTMPSESNPYVTPAPAAASSSRNAMDSVRGVLGRWGKKVGEAAKATEDLAGNVWQHLKTGPSVAESAMGMIAQSSKIIAEGGYEKIFKNTFDTVPDEQLMKTYACYLSTSAGPVLGILYLSSAKLAFCSDNPLSYKVGDKTEWSYYKVVIPLHQLRTVNPTTSKVNPAEKYIQVVSIDNHEFWFMGFVNYDSAVKSLQEASVHNQQP